MPVVAALAAWMVFFSAFSGIDHLFENNDQVGSADSASFFVLLSQWHLSGAYGDAFEVPRTAAARNQEHKIKHPLHPIVLSPLYRTVAVSGLSQDASARFVGASVGAISIGLMLVLMARCGLGPGLALPLALIGIAAPAMVVYNGLLESWPLSGLLLMLAIGLHRSQPDAVTALGVLAGVSMLCNVSGFFAVSLPVMLAMQRRRSLSEVGLVFLKSAAVAITVFLAGLLVLSAAEPDLRPDRYFRFLTFFSDLMKHPQTFTPRAVVFSLSQLFVTAFASLQAGTDLTGCGVCRTWSHSVWGRFAMVCTVAAWLAVVGLFVRDRMARDIEATSNRALSIRLAVLVACHWAFFHVGHYPSLLLYSSALVPVLLFGSGLVLSGHQRRPAVVACTWALAGVLAVTSALQMSSIRFALSSVG